MVTIVTRYIEYQAAKIVLDTSTAIPDLEVNAVNVDVDGIFDQLWAHDYARKLVIKAGQHPYGEVLVYDEHGRCLAGFCDLHRRVAYAKVSGLTTQINRCNG